MEKLLESVINDRTTILNFIQYEVIWNKPIFDGYRSFCETLGPEIMKYEEFEFWFMRFSNGELDLDCDKKKKSLAFSDLPDDIIDRVVKELNPVTRILTRHVCRSLRSHIDHQDPIIIKIGIHMLFDNVYLKLQSEKFGEKHIGFQKIENGCHVYDTRGGSFDIMGVHYMKLAFNELKKIVNNGTIDEFEYWISHQFEYSGDVTKKIFESLHFDSQLHVKYINIQSHFACVNPILKMLVPGTLEKIRISASFLETIDNGFFDETVELEQFKQAKIADVYTKGGLRPAQLYHLFRFDKFSARLETLSRDLLVELKNHITTSPSFIECKIVTNHFEIDDVRAVFGAEILEKKAFQFEIPLKSSRNILRQLIQKLSKRKPKYLEIFVEFYYEDHHYLTIKSCKN